MRDYVVLTPVHAIRVAAVFVWLVGAWFGSQTQCPARDVWLSPAYAIPYYGAADDSYVEQAYAQAHGLEDQGCASCVDGFFEVAMMTASAQCAADPAERFRRLHESSLQKLVVLGQQFGRLDARRGLMINRNGAALWIPITHHGFVWRPNDFDQLVVVGDYLTKSLSTSYRCPGVGIPLVVTRCRPTGRNFLSAASVFAATLRLSPGHGCATKLELYDPLRVDTVRIGHSSYRLAKDHSAPIAYRLYSRPSNMLDRFIHPNSESPDTGNAEGTLYTIEPYQAGKTPVVLIHGLLSDPFTWAEMVNELLACPQFVRQFQIWVYEYPTGRPFLGSAAELRIQLEAACRTFDPGMTDPELSNIILAGHSMGGLIAKLQITTSGNDLWNSVANLPFDQVAMSPALRNTFSKSIFFNPSPRVTRVVYFATPHRGSAIASRLIGRISSSLVRAPAQTEQEYAELVDHNPGVFSREVTRGVPTSIDILEPKSQLLQAIDRLPIRCGVSTHSIIGDFGVTLKLGRSDGVVPVKNALDPHAITQRIVHATHSGVKDHPAAIAEFQEILLLHLKAIHQPVIPASHCR